MYGGSIVESRHPWEHEVMSEQRAALRAALGPVGVWSFALQTHPAAEARSAMIDYESQGYRATWYPESLGSKEAFAHAAILLGASPRMILASGIANIHARDPMAMANGARTLAEAYPGRFVLGIGVSHAPSVATRGGSYGHPIESMTAYLDAMEAAAYAGPPPPQPAPLVLAALGPRMLELAAVRTDGAHSYFVPVDHTAFARARLGTGAFLAVEQTAVLDSDRYLRLPNYTNNLRRLGWGDDDLADGGSDRLLDAVVVQGDPEAIASRVRAHLDAGADHVCVQLRSADPGDLCLDGYAALRAELAPLLDAPPA
jgi:probable F420-dependent oxidoreductase